MVLLNVTTVLLPGTTVPGAKLTVVPAGTPAVALKTTGTTYPPVEVVPKVTVADVGALHAMVVAAGVVKSKLAAGIARVKLVLEISKKIFPTDMILILAVVDGVLGIVTTSVPSFGVLATRTVGKVNPPSVDNRIFTLAQFTGAAVVLATAHVTVCDEPPSHETFVFGIVTWKGPEVLVTVTAISVKAVWPTLIPTPDDT